MNRRQEGRRKHTAEQTRMSAQTDGQMGRGAGGGGWRDGREGYLQFRVFEGEGDMWLTLEEMRGAAGGRKEETEKKKERLVKWHFGDKMM